MWNQTVEPALGGGGFFSNDGASPAANGLSSSQPGGKRPSDRIQNVVPVSLAALASVVADEPLRVAGVEVNLTVLAGRLETVDRSPVKIAYTLTHGGSSVTAVRWVDAETDGGGGGGVAGDADVSEGMLCRLMASVRPTKAGGAAAVRCFDIRQISDEEMQLHQLEIQHAELKIRQLESGVLSTGGAAGAGSLSNSTMGAVSDVPMVQTGGMTGLSAQQQLVYSVIQAATSEEGASRDAVMTGMRGRLSRTEVERILEFLSNEGHVYNTTDDDHFKATDC